MTHKPSKFEFLTKSTLKKAKKEDTVRLKALNGLLYKALTELLSTPEVSQEVYELNVELSKVSTGQGWGQGTGLASPEPIIPEVLVWGPRGGANSDLSQGTRCRKRAISSAWVRDGDCTAPASVTRQSVRSLEMW